jgi:hypothetical protein
VKTNRSHCHSTPAKIRRHILEDRSTASDPARPTIVPRATKAPHHSVSQSPVDALKATRITDPLSLTAEAAEEARGAFFLSFGKAGSGKTTLHFHMLRYIEQAGDFEGEEVVGEHLPEGQRVAQAAIMNQWRNMWLDGNFPAGTNAEDEVRAIRYSLRPRIGSGPKTEVTFLEVAGELLARVIADDPRDRVDLPEALDRLFRNKEVKLIVAFIVSPRGLQEEADARRPDALYVAFLNFIRERYPDRIRTPLLVVVADPHRAFETIKEIVPTGDTELTTTLTEQYLTTFLPSFMQQYVTWKAPAHQKLIARFRVGKVMKRSVDGDPRLYIGHPPYYDDAARITKFMYETFNGITIRHNFLRRVLIAIGLSSR